MLALWGLITIVTLIALIASRRVSTFAALLLVPVLAALLSGAGQRTGTYMLSGLQAIAPVVAMFLFAILFFGILSDAGLLQPLTGVILWLIGKRPVLIVPGTALLALLVHLDGSGAVVFLVTIPTLLPLYSELGMDRRVLAAACSLAAGVNFLPWTGPTLRAAAALHMTPIALWRPLLWVQIIGLVYVFAVAVLLGRREERRLSTGQALRVSEDLPLATASTRQHTLDTPTWRLAANFALTAAVLGGAISGKVEPALLFLAGTALALLLNFRDVREQQGAFERHASAAISMCAILFAAGSFNGIMKGTGMLAAMANVLAAHVPATGVHHLPLALGFVAMPLSLLFDPDSYYFGVMPVLASTVQSFGIPAVSIAHASLLGQMTTGFPISPLTPSTFLVTGLSGIELGAHQRFSFLPLLGASVLMTLAAACLHVLPW